MLYKFTCFKDDLLLGVITTSTVARFNTINKLIPNKVQAGYLYFSRNIVDIGKDLQANQNQLHDNSLYPGSFFEVAPVMDIMNH